MARLVDVSGFLVEVTEPSVSANGSGYVEAGGVLDGLHKLAENVTLENTISKVISRVRMSLDDANNPDELTISFKIGFQGELAVPYLAKGSAESSLTIEAKWRAAAPTT